MEDRNFLEDVAATLLENNDGLFELENWIEKNKNAKNASAEFYFPSYHLKSYIRNLESRHRDFESEITFII
jgi:hypothetical protein